MTNPAANIILNGGQLKAFTLKSRTRRGWAEAYSLKFQSLKFKFIENWVWAQKMLTRHICTRKQCAVDTHLKLRFRTESSNNVNQGSWHYSPDGVGRGPISSSRKRRGAGIGQEVVASQSLFCVWTSCIGSFSQLLRTHVKISKYNFGLVPFTYESY